MKRIFSLTVSFIIVLCTVFSNTVLAESEAVTATAYEYVDVSEDGEYTVSGELRSGTLYDVVEYMNYSRQDVRIVLSGDVKLSRGVTLHPVIGTTSYLLIKGNVTLDLNGHFITQLAGAEYSQNPVIIVPKGSVLTLMDSSDTQKGTVNGVQFAIKVIGGTLNLEGGNVQSQSQASYEYDDAELPLSLIKGSTFNMSGGAVIYDGELSDGRTYYDKSCAVVLDRESSMSVSGGRILGSVEIEETENIHITGGTFTFDVSKHLSAIYDMTENNGEYTVIKNIPRVLGEANGESLEVEVEAEYHQTEERVTKYSVLANPPQGAKRSLTLELKEIFKSALSFGRGKIPTIEVYTDFAVIKFDELTINRLYGNGLSKAVNLVLEKNSNLSNEIIEKVGSAKYSLTYRVVDENDKIINPDATVSISILHSSVNAVNGVQLYYITESTILAKNATIRGNTIECDAVSNEKMLISEGRVIMITGRTLDLQGTISMIFYATLDGVDVSDARMLFWDSPQEEYTEETAERVVSYSGKDSYGYRFKYDNISSKDMNKMIYARLCVKDENGKTIYGSAPQDGYSVVSYAQNMMKNERLKPLLVKMLNYGAAAQEYFGSEYEPANSVLTESEKVMDFTRVYRSEAQTIVEETTNGRSEAGLVGKTLVLEGDISINYYVSSTQPVDEVGILFWTEDSFELSKSHIMGTQSGLSRSYTTSGEYKIFTFENIVSRQMFDSIYARVYTRKGNIYQYSDIDKYSVRDYAANQIEKNDNPGLIKLLRCLLLYGDAAERYFRLN